jgi:hypothetical protein
MSAIAVDKGGRRKGFKMPEEHRSKLKVSQLLNRLQQCALGEISLPPDQVKCLEIALRKSLPDLSQVEVQSEVAHYVARLPTVAPSAAAWLESVDVPDPVSVDVPDPVIHVLSHDQQPVDTQGLCGHKEGQDEEKPEGE